MVMVRLGSSPRSKQLSASGGDMVNCGKRLRPRELEPPCDLAFPLLFTTSSFGHPTSSTALSLSLLACSLMTQRAPPPCIPNCSPTALLLTHSPVLMPSG